VTAYVVIELEPPDRHARRAAPAPGARLADELEAHGGRLLTDITAASDAAEVTVAVADFATAERLAAALRARDDVRTAYAKPGEALP
jgi:hypothetical protein